MMKHKIKFFLIFSATMLLIALISFIAVKSYLNLSAKGSIFQASELANKGKYHEAFEKLRLVDNKWLTASIKKELDDGKKDYDKLKSSSVNFDKGRRAYESKDYKEAIIYFKGVLIKDINYKYSEKWIISANEKLSDRKVKDVSKSSVAGIKVQAAEEFTHTEIKTQPELNTNIKTYLSPSTATINSGFNQSNQEPTQQQSQTQPTYAQQPTSTYISPRKPSTEYCNSQLAYLKSKYQSTLGTENRNYQIKLSGVNESFASRGLYGSGTHKTEQGLLAVEHNENLELLKREHERNLISLENEGCNF